MKTDKEMIDLYESMYKDNMMWFVLGSLISSDSFYGITGQKLLKTYKESISRLKKINKLILKTNIPQEDKEKIKELSKEGADLLIHEYNNILMNYESNGIVEKGKFKLIKK